MAVLASLTIRDMSMRSITSVDAQNNFGALIDTAQREPVTITRRGRPVVMVVSAVDGQELVRKLVADRLATYFSNRVETPAAAALSEADITRLVHEVR